MASSPLLSLLLPLLLLAAPALAAPQPWRDPGSAPRQAVVEAIGDGDSLHVRAGDQRFTVRLACIDAPELAQAPEGPASHRYLLTRLRRGSRVRLIPHDIDRFGRLVAEVIGGVNLNLALVEDGQAFVDPRHVQHCQAQSYWEAEERAARNQLGVWQLKGGTERPWLFRARHRRRHSRAQLPGLPSGLGIGRSTVAPITSGTPAA
ncbi:thermonuclease family protein [Cyanobium sp. FGCU-52]|nr:thermonuclease family protein [Cyanobium sp. FGCU52]